MEFASLIISGISLILAIYSLRKSIKSQDLQDRVNEIELKLKEYELAEKEKQQQKEACIEARVIHVNRSNYKIKIWNSGNSIAKNITASWDDTNEILLLNKDKMPFEFLEPQKGFELSVFAYDGSVNKLCIKTEWEDDRSEMHEKTQWCDL